MPEPPPEPEDSFPPPGPTEPSPEWPEDSPAGRADLEGHGLTRHEYISAMVHFYRGEMYRATAWRLRLDNTTNWAIISAGGLLTFSFGHPESSHLVLLLGQSLLFSFLWIESRRYRFFDVWRSRVRKIEENFYNPILTRKLISPDPTWGDVVARDLSSPSFKMSRWHAMHQRMHANYLLLFVVLNVAWVSKLVIHPTPTKQWMTVLDRLNFGLIPWWGILIGVVAFYLVIGAIYVVPGHATQIRGRQWGMGDEDIEEEER